MKSRWTSPASCAAASPRPAATSASITARGGGRVRGRRSGDRVVLEVHDDGAGIPAEHLPRLFERFYRVDPGRSRERGGTGLGLAIVKHLVESMGGTVDVSSAAGDGTTFRVEVPAWGDGA